MLFTITLVIATLLVAALIVRTPSTFFFDLINDNIEHEFSPSRR